MEKHLKNWVILDHIDSGHMALPEFQRGYAWNCDQVRGLFEVLSDRLELALDCYEMQKPILNTADATREEPRSTKSINS